MDATKHASESRRRLVAAAASLLQGDLGELDGVASSLGVSREHLDRCCEDVLAIDLDGLRQALLHERDVVADGALVLTSAAPRPSEADVSDAPTGLSTAVTVEKLGPLAGHTVVLGTVGPVAVTGALWSLMRDRAPVTPYTVGVLTRAWGRGGAEQVPTRCVRLLEEPSEPHRTGVERWHHPVDWYASFAFDGSVSRIEQACTWIAACWTPRAALRLGYGPLLVLMEGLPDWRGRARATIHLAIAELPTG